MPSLFETATANGQSHHFNSAKSFSKIKEHSSFRARPTASVTCYKLSSPVETSHLATARCYSSQLTDSLRASLESEIMNTIKKLSNEACHELWSFESKHKRGNGTYLPPLPSCSDRYKTNDAKLNYCGVAHNIRLSELDFRNQRT